MERKKLILILILILSFFIILFLIRFINYREIDDISPHINCEKEYIEKSEILWIIPKYKNISISENKTWCEEILKLNKTLGLHGITHTYREFLYEKITQEEITESIKIFEECFNQTPTIFKAPQLALSKENKKLLKNNNLKIRSIYDQTIHKVYHCSDTGILPNKFHDIF